MANRQVNRSSHKAAIAFALPCMLGAIAVSLLGQGCEETTPEETPSVTTPDAAKQDTGTDSDPGDTATIPTGTVKGTIAYAGDKRGTVVIAFMDYIPAPGAPPNPPPKVAGFALSNPTTFPGTFSAKVAPGKWFVFAYMSVGQPPHLDGPRVPMEPLDPAPPQVEVKVDETVNTEVHLIDLGGPPPSDGGSEGGDADAGTGDPAPSDAGAADAADDADGGA